jgi:hypothetical protein
MNPKKLKYCLAVICIGIVSSLYAQKIQIKLRTEDNQPIGFANVIVDSTTVYFTNDDGFCTFFVKSSKPKVFVTISHVSYSVLTFEISAKEDTFYSIQLRPIVSEEIVINGSRSFKQLSADGAVQLSRKFIEVVPSFMGSSNFTMALKTLPGVQATNDFSSGFVVRGGDVDQNQVLIDNVNLYNLNHVGGVFPIINNEIINSLNFYSSPVPSKHGGRLSSYTVVETRSPSFNKKSTKFRIGLLDADFTFESPIIKDKLSIFSSNRFVHFLPLLAAVRVLYSTNTINSSGNLGFYDSYNKVVFLPSDKLKINLLAYKNKDYYNIKERSLDITEQSSSTNWGNEAISLSAVYNQNKSLLWKIGSYFTSYQRQGEELDLKLNSNFPDSIIGFSRTKGNIRDITTFVNLDHSSKLGRILFGSSLTKRDITPSSFESSNQPNLTPSFTNLSMIEANAFGHIYLNLSSKLKSDLGARLNQYSGQDFTYRVIEPRINVKMNFSDYWSTLASFAKTVQPVFQIGGSLAGINDEYWFQVSKDLMPQTAQTFSFGQNFTKSIWSFESKVFYKKMNNLIDAQIAIIPSYYISHDNVLQSIIKGVQGEAYGVENAFNCQFSSTTFNLAYTWSRSTRNHPDIFDGDTYRSTFDRPHVINLSFINQLSSKWTFSANWILQSGHRYSKPIGFYQDFQKIPKPIYIARNNEQLPSYHRLDLGLTRTWISKKDNKKQLWLNIINVYNRKNISYLYEEYDQDILRFRKVTLIPILPTIAYAVEF